MYYIPVKKKDGRTIKEMHETLREAVGDRAAKIIIDKTMAIFGGVQLYVPIERNAFEETIAEEIYRRNMDENVRMYEIFHDYGICFTKAYRLWKIGRRIKLNKEMRK